MSLDQIKIPGFERYAIQKDGFVINLKTGRILYGYGKSYLIVGLCRNGNPTWFYIHRLVAESFIPNPEGKLEVNHKDGNPSNNNIKNLEWVTKSENMLHSFAKLNRRPSFLGRAGKLHPRSMPIIAQKVNSGESFIIESISLSRQFGFNPSNVCQVIKGKRSHHKNYTFKYSVTIKN